MVPFTGEAVKVPPLQIVVVIAVSAGFGFTVTVILYAGPGQLPEAGVTV